MTTDSFSFTINASIVDPDGRTAFDDEILARAQGAAVASLADDGIALADITYSHEIVDESAGSGTGDDFDVEPES